MGTNSLGPQVFISGGRDHDMGSVAAVRVHPPCALHLPPPVLFSYVMLKSSLDWIFSLCTFYEKDRLAERDKTAQSFPVTGTDKIKQPASTVLCI